MSEPTRQELEAAIAEQRSKPDYVRQLATFCDAPERAALLACAYKIQAQDAEIADLRAKLAEAHAALLNAATPIVNISLSDDAAYWKARAEEAERKLGDLLARIHRDGGHYTGQHGMEKSVEDAHTIVATLFADERKLEEAGNMLPADLWNKAIALGESRGIERAIQIGDAKWQASSEIARPNWVSIRNAIRAALDQPEKEQGNG